MRALIRLAEIVFWLALIVWISAIVTAGVTAAVAFPMMREYEVVVPKFAAYDESQHWAIAAGVLLERIFTLTDMIQLAAAVIAILALVAGARRRSRLAELLRFFTMLAAATLLGYRVLLLAPQMNRSLHQYWDAAEQGQADTAAQYRSEFQAMHPTASRIYGIMLFMLLTSAGATAWSPPIPSPAVKSDGLQEPQLARRASR